MQAINKLASFFNTVRQAIFHFKPNGFDSRKAMLRYKKYKATPPEFTGITKIAASLIFPQLDRQIRDFENGKKGGRPKRAENNNINKEESQQDEQGQEWDELINIASRKSASLRAERESRAKALRK